MTAPTQLTDSPSGPVVSVDDVVAVSQEIWSAFLGLDLEPHHPGPVPSPSMTGCVQITGEWEGAVLVSCSMDFARTATEAMFATDEVSDEDILDAVGELTNMVGGSIKSLLPSPSHLSVPSVSSGEKYEVHIPGTTALHELILGCGPEPISIGIWHA